MYFGANSPCRIENSVGKAAVFLHPLYIIGLRIVPRDTGSYCNEYSQLASAFVCPGFLPYLTILTGRLVERL